MEFLESLKYIGPYIWLAIVPVVIFSITPRAPRGLKSGRILFLWLIVTIIFGFITYLRLSSDKTYICCVSKTYYYAEEIFLFFWMIFLVNVYIGWWEFLWRCIYRQWTWPPLKNIQYGIISNLCILGSASLSIPLASIIILAKIYRLF